MQQLYCLGTVKFLIESPKLDLREGYTVSLAPSLSFIAICAAFLFIGAILIGAF